MDVVVRHLAISRLTWRVLTALFPFAVLIAIWQLAAAAELWPRTFLPAPTQLPPTAYELVLEGSLLGDIAVTSRRLIFGAAMGFGLGIVFAVLLALVPVVWRATRDIINYMQAIGEIGWLPLFVLWVGFNERTIVLVIAYTVFFPTFSVTFSGFRSIPSNLINSVATLGGGRWTTMKEVVLPGTLPSMIVGLRTGMGFGWRTVILAEMLVAQEGLGVLLFNARSLFQPDRILVGMIAAGVLWLAMDRLLLQPFEARTVERWGIQRKAT